jgi:GNAT superfamily N-acetyltransferase
VRTGWWFAEAVGRIAGFAAAGPSFDDLPVREPELHALYVTAVLHGTGVGQTLFDRVVAGRPGACDAWTG